MKSKYSNLILRLGLGIVFLIFGIGKFRNDIWSETIKNMTLFQNLVPFSLDIFVILIGVVEVLIAIFLIFGLFTRITALVAALELISILFLLKFQDVREIGLLAIALVLLLERSE